MDPNLAGFAISSAAAAVFIAAEWRWPNEPHRPLHDLWLNTLAAALMIAVTVVVVAGLGWLLPWAFGRVDLVHSWSPVGRTLLFIVLSDACRYAVHRLMHRPGWWRVHRLHHSIEVVNWYSGMRAAPLHVALFVLPLPLLAWLLDLGMLALAVNLTLMGLSNHLMHANVRIPQRLQRWLEWVIVTPRFHRPHHSDDPDCRDTNFGAVFTIWDRWFGTYVDPDRLQGRRLNYGLGEPGPPNWPRILIGL
jgi:sterol desaturase/sphingolipid hydroxylase (fatty acid hydroxylase superfamily)